MLVITRILSIKYSIAIELHHLLQVVHEGNDWKLVGFTDMGEFLNSLDSILNPGKEKTLATPVLQVTFNGYSGFRWPVAYFGSNTATAYQLYWVFWKSVEIWNDNQCTVDYCNLDGTSTNRSFINKHFSSNQREERFSTSDTFYPDHKVVFIQDIKHI